MEAIKISVDVNVNFSESAMAFIKSLFTPVSCGCNTFNEESAKPAEEEAKLAKPAEEEAKPAKEEAVAVERSIEDVRKVLAEKVNEHRETIKQKLNALGAPSVTKLDPAKYDEMYNFLMSL